MVSEVRDTSLIQQFTDPQLPQKPQLPRELCVVYDPAHYLVGISHLSEENVSCPQVVEIMKEVEKPGAEWKSERACVGKVEIAFLVTFPSQGKGRRQRYRDIGKKLSHFQLVKAWA